MSSLRPRSTPAHATGLSEHQQLAEQFEFVRFLGAGPDGTRIAARRLDGGAEVELRFVQEHAQTGQLTERWARYQLLDHAQVVSLQQVEAAGSDWCAVLDTAPLGSLEAALGREWSVEAGLRLLGQVAGALAAAHELGLWHGELAPSSVLLDPQRGARLEFTGVSVWGDVGLFTPARVRWQAADAYDDLLDLALLAERLLGGAAAAARCLPWLAGLKDPDPCKRAPAAEVVRLIDASLQAVIELARREFQTVDTERPLPQPRVSHPVAAAPSNLVQTLVGVHPGTRIGRFQVERLLGEGGMGSVYRAVDVASGQCVALKLLKPELLSDEAALYRFRKEARVLKAVQSPYVANLVEAELSAAQAYIALEFIDGDDLATVLHERAAPVPELLGLQIVADLCRALVEPHRRGIVHRDIKPHNVLLVGDLAQPEQIQIKLCDFGIASARLSAETVGMTQDGRLWGTPQYMAPEQCTSSPVSPATDVYALGLTLYELIAGRPAFSGTDLVQLLRKQVSEEPERLSQCATVSEGTAALVARALDKTAARRFADAGELLLAIESVRTGQVRPAERGAAQAVDAARGRPERIEFSVDLGAAAHDLWPYVSDTERLNQVIGLPPVHVERLHEDGSLKTFLSNQVLGMRLRWQEYPFEWIEGHRWSVLRVFEAGLMRWYRVTLELEPLGSGGTRLRYAMEFVPRFKLLALLVRFEVGVKQRARLLRVFRRVDELIQQGTIRRTPSPHQAPPAADRALARRISAELEKLESAGVERPVLEALEQHILLGSEAEIARLRPLRFARARGLDERAFTEACLLAAHGGLLDLLWDVVCPLCQIPATFAESLQRLETHGRCPACELSFPLQFADSVELVFRVSPDVRPSELAAYCIGGPAHSPHVAAQLRLGPGEGSVLSLALSDGRHRIRSPELPGVLELDISSEHAFARADLVIGARLRALKGAPLAGRDARLALEVSEPSVRLGSGQQTIGLRNELDREVTVRIERSAEREDALTAARAWSLPKFRELFPGETLESGRLVAVGQVSFLVLRVAEHLRLIERSGDAVALTETLRIFDRLQASAEKHHGRMASSSMDFALVAFERSADAVAACLDLFPALGDPALVGASLALHRGPAVATSIDERMAYYGQTLARALELSLNAPPRQLIISFAALGERLAELTLEPGLVTTVHPAPVLGPAAWCVHVESASSVPANDAVPVSSATLGRPELRRAASD